VCVCVCVCVPLAPAHVRTRARILSTQGGETETRKGQEQAATLPVQKETYVGGELFSRNFLSGTILFLLLYHFEINCSLKILDFLKSYLI
jgi:hypothetical protein